MLSKIKPFAFLSLLLFLNCGKKEGDLFSHPQPKKTGIDFKNEVVTTSELNILDYLYFYNGGGVAVGDINNDGLPDIFFSGNQVKNKLYLNKGDLNFEDITETAGVAGNSDWNTGVVIADVNGDGLLDIYVCAVVGLKGLNGFNELYINNGDSTFTESAAKFGLDFDSYSSNAAFFDYDLDGDLDMYLLNHAVHTEKSFGKADLRYERSYETGDKLLRNDGGKFIDVSEDAGIFGGINGYGLGLAIADFNVDGYPDIYVGNDFHEDDYYYLNNGDGTFTESLQTYFGHTSRFSMGNDVADINHDGLPDLISLDMLPEDEVPLKASEGDDNLQTQKMRIGEFGYHYQFTRNMLSINQPDGKFLETALLSGVAATDWSWSALFGDYDQDGHQDLFVSNGIPKRPNDLDFIKFVSSDEIAKKIDNTKLVDTKALDLMPTGNVGNYVFKGNGALGFEDLSNEWITNDTIMSGATAYGDFDNDGDLDLVTNNLNDVARLYINKTNQKTNFLKLKFEYEKGNVFGVGTKVYAYAGGRLQYKELQPTRGFQASSQPILHFGFGNLTNVDSLKIVWPNRQFQVLKDVATNQELTISQEGTKPYDFQGPKKLNRLFKISSDSLGLDVVHTEDNYLHFNREKTIPYQISDRGPAFSIADLNNDGKEDIYMGGSKFYPNQILFQQDSTFVRDKIPALSKDSVQEIVTSVIADFNGDGRNDVILGAGGADFFGKSNALLDSYYASTGEGHSKIELPAYFENTSVIKEFDYDADGDLDVFIGHQSITSEFGKKPTSVLLKNSNGQFEIDTQPDFSKLGMVTDAVWSDFDNDGNTDLIVVGEWMQPSFFKNDGRSLKQIESPELYGLWQSIAPFDIDNDGDSDYLLGNWGLNSKFRASKASPMLLYTGDIDKNGSSESVVAIEKDGDYYTIATLDDLAGQMVSLRKKFPNYTAFAGKSVDEIFDQKELDNTTQLQVNTLESGYLKNEGGRFSFVPLPESLQTAPIFDFELFDFDGDGKIEALAGGNYFGVKPYHGRFDSFPGALIKNINDVILGGLLGLDFTKKSIRHLKVMTLNGKSYLIAVFNDAPIEVYDIMN